MTTARKISALIIAATVVALMALTTKTLFFKAKEHSAETTQLAVTAEKLEQKVVTLEDHVEEMSKRRATLLSVIDFHIDNPRTVLFIASRDGVILEVEGSVVKWGYTKNQLIGTRIEELRPKAERIAYKLNYSARAGEGKTGEVYFFEDKILLGGDGNEYRVHGGVFWHGEREEFVAFLAPRVSESP